MAYAFVQQNANDNAASATTITVTLTPSAGNLLVFCAAGEAGDTASIALSDNLGVHNTFTQIGTDLVSVLNERCTWWFAANCKGGATTFTATFTAGTRFRAFYVAEYSGITTTAPFLNGARAEQAAPLTTTDAVTSGVADATSQPALVWGFSINVNGGTPPAAGTGFTSRTNVWSSATCQGRPEDKRVTATGNVAATFTATVGTDPHANGVGIFLEAASTPTVSSWVPDFPDRAPGRRSISMLSVIAAPVMAIALPAMSWSPSFPDRAPRRPVPNLATGTAVEPVFVPAPAAPAPAMSWSPVYPDRLPRARAAPIVGGMAKPESTLPNAAVPSIFPLSLSSNGRHLRKSDGTPFLICGDSTWSLSVNLPAADQATFLDDCVAKGVTSVMSNAIEHHYTVVKAPKDVDGNLPFTQRMDAATYTGSPNGTPSASGTQGQFSADNYSSISTQSPDPTFINNTYWGRVDALLAACLSRNIAVFVWPMYLGFHGGQEGWIAEMEQWDAVTGAGGFTGQGFADPTKSKMWNYGAWLGARWAQYPNVIWVAGGDYGSNSQTLNAAQSAAVKSCIDGVKSQQPNSLWTAHWDRPCKSDDTLVSGTPWALNFCYTDDNTAEATRAAYSSAAKPAYLGENNYEDGLFGGTLPFRKYLYWGFLGGIAGGFYGQEQLWRFDDGSPGTLWSTLLTRQGRLDAARQYAFWSTRPWHRLVPNGLGGIGTLITAGGGTASPQSTDYVAAAATPERDLLLAYVPPAHTGSVTIDMTKLGASVTSRWFDPTNATFTAIGTFANTGTRAFTTPGNNSAGEADWLLVLDAPDAPMPLSWAPVFPDRALRSRLGLAQVVSGVVEPVAPPPPATLASWSPDFPDRAPRARQPVNAGGAFAPEATLPNPLFSWIPSFPDRLATPAIRLHAGVTAPPTDTNAGVTWLSRQPDPVSRPRAAQLPGGEVAPIFIAPAATTPALSWSPVFPDFASKARQPVNDGGMIKPEAALPNPPAPDLSWSPGFPDFAPRARQPVNTGGSTKPEATLPNAPAPAMSWLPTMPTGQLRRATPVVMTGGMSAPDAVLPDPIDPDPIDPDAGVETFADLVREMDDLIIEVLG